MESVVVGERGQVTIPKKLRDRFGIKSRSVVVFEAREDGIMMRPLSWLPTVAKGCIFFVTILIALLRGKGEKDW